MKNKRSKSSIFYDSTKNKGRKQEKNRNFKAFNKENSDDLKQKPTFLYENQAYSHKDNKFSYRNPSAIAPFFISEDNTSFRPNYTYKKNKPEKEYLYDFTNSRFIYFLGSLDPKSYLLFITLIALLITEELNRTEAKIIYAFVSNLSDTIQTLIEQEVILENYKQIVESRELGNALQKDLETIYAQLNEIKKKLPN